MANLLVCLLLVNYIRATWLQKVLSEPILNVTKATKESSREGNYKLRVHKQGNDEIGDLVDEYNEMLSQIYVREEALNLLESVLTHLCVVLKPL
ncbi:HAMP domain-containing protein, partial [Algibacter sp. TI.3.09]|uniref:HAMP domain-containing protein n=1 Tax=Algibacter sp. TI.3.09 TaxID=3121298 RepID=UPI00311EC93F